MSIQHTPRALEENILWCRTVSSNPVGNPSRTWARLNGKGEGGQRQASPRLLRPSSWDPTSSRLPAPVLTTRYSNGSPPPPRSFTLTRLCMWLRHSRCTRSDSSASSSNTSPSSSAPWTKEEAWTHDIPEATAGPPDTGRAGNSFRPEGRGEDRLRGSRHRCACAKLCVVSEGCDGFTGW